MANRLLLSKIAFCATLLCSSAFASSNGAFYFGGGYGRAQATAPAGSETTGPASVKKWANAGKGFVGYQFNDYFALEGTYFQMGAIAAGQTSATTNMGKLTTYALELSGVGFIPITQQFSFGANAGIYHDRYRLRDISYFDGVNRSPVASTGFGYGAFAQYMVVQNGSVRLAFDQLLSRAHANAVKTNPTFFTLNIAINLGAGDNEAS